MQRGEEYARDAVFENLQKQTAPLKKGKLGTGASFSTSHSAGAWNTVLAGFSDCGPASAGRAAGDFGTVALSNSSTWSAPAVGYVIQHLHDAALRIMLVTGAQKGIAFKALRI